MSQSKSNESQLQIIVPCPARLQRRMLRNLEKAKVDRIKPVRAEKAINILAVIEAQSKADDVAKEDKINTTKMAAAASKVTTTGATTPRTEIRRATNSMFHKCFKYISPFYAFVKSKRFFRPAYSKV
jgi:hypothetical protein